MTNARVGTMLAAVVLSVQMVVAQAQPAASAAWVLTPAAGATSASAYAVVENPTMYEIYVVSVTTDAAGAVELADGTGETAKKVAELAVPSFGSTELKPGGVHMVLKDLKKPLAAGDQVPLTLTTDSGAIIKVVAEVKDKA
jgi:periplasmic copper chaperone A